MQVSFADNIHLPLQEVFEVLHEGYMIHQALPRFHLYQNIPIALPGPASPRATEPKTRRLWAPCLAAMSRISWRLAFSKSSIFIGISGQTLKYNKIA